jgi:hypothetical protein
VIAKLEMVLVKKFNVLHKLKLRQFAVYRLRLLKPTKQHVNKSCFDDKRAIPLRLNCKL